MLNSDGSTLYIADSGNNRIVVCNTMTGCIKSFIGGMEKGFQDGSFNTARFSNPQGMILDEHILYVADADNHSIRKWILWLAPDRKERTKKVEILELNRNYPRLLICSSFRHYILKKTMFC